ncbi:Spermidine Putrescine ABC transporter permease component potC [Candidatus Rhodobacter oscarellae]|uniref:Spermidine Putrescine ABC transporter permease component potC n=1 Tax=Candidatus Rhodobacter oscarellae TaxID=1675527 RepID=A0A0J9EBX7_9RHOB|nr:ABC transporter permease [Candidatus Rhodobacter lobularis]KMW60277.1 Spermidine Putrescine ABC transporter permease component potC [Candidatus Rhodobacter lobularis]
MASKPYSEALIPGAFKWISGLTLFILLAPMVVVILSGLNAGEFLTFPPEGLSLRWIEAFFASDIFLGAYFYSLIIALITMVISLILGTAISLFLIRSTALGRNMIRAVVMAPIMLPGIVIGLALYLFYISSDIGLARTQAGLVIGHVLVTCPYVIGMVSAALVGFDRSLEEAARSLGASRWTTFRKITMPMISPALIAGGVFAFIVSFGQFDVSLFLTPPNNTPLPIALYSSLRYTFEPTAAAAGIFAIALVVVSMVITAKITSLRRLTAATYK